MKTKGGFEIENFRKLEEPITHGILEPHIYSGFVKKVANKFDEGSGNYEITWDKFGRCANLNREDIFIDILELNIAEPSINNESSLAYGDQVKCSMDKDFNEFWIGTYIAKHPTADEHIVLLRGRPQLKINETLDSFTYCQKQKWSC